ncbi:MAG TPA: ABC transporter permease [Xanthobacteraceae bacterium]|jgi:branched-chain amino acid transport system permease protein|nr:ABC transporter permease [Xanthobacteraceae bacterium]
MDLHLDLFVAQLLNGLVYGVLLFLMAAGLSLIFGLMNVVSLAHGSFFMLGAFVGLAIYKASGNFWLALILAPLPITMLGVLVERLFLRPLYKRGHMDQVLLTFGFTFVFLDLVQTVWGRMVLRLPAPQSLQGIVHIGAGVFSAYRLFLIGFGFAIALLLWLLLERSRIGAMVRAGVDNAMMAAGLGANIPALFTGIFGFGVALAALGGIAAAPVLGLYPGMDSEILIPAFIVIVIGGMGSLRGAFVGSLLIGIADTFGKAYFPSVALFLVYLAMTAVLLVRPQGLFGIKYSDIAIAPAVTTTSRPATLQTRAAELLVLAVLIVLPFLMSDYPRALVAEIFIFAILAMSLDLLLGFTGLMSLGHAAFFGLGAYAVAILGVQFGLNAWLGVAAGVIIAGAGAALIGFFCVRTGGIPFLMLTLAFSQLVFSVALKWRDLTGGSDGMAIAEQPTFLGFSLSKSLPMYFMTLCFFVLAYWGLRRLLNSPLGHAFVGIRENEPRMMAIGYPTRAYKLMAFTIAGAVAGLAGGLYAIFNGFISSDAVYWTASGDILIMTMLGGAGTLIGPALGTAIFLLMKNVASSYSEHWLSIIGVTFICCVMFFPGGLWGSLQKIRWQRALK